MKSRKAAKILIKRAKKQPDLYSTQEVQYAKLFRKHERKINNSDTERRGNDGLCGRVSNPNNQDNPKSGWFTWLLHKTSALVSFRASTHDSRDRDNERNSSTDSEHRSFTYQEFSQRYANTNMLGKIDVPDLRSQDDKNRQNSIDDIPQDRKRGYKGRFRGISLKDLTYTMNSYVRVLRRNVRDLFSL